MSQMLQCGAKVYPEKLKEKELKLLEARESSLDNAVGLALSGGGIRSATFSLGLLQSLARHELLRRIDFLSTVSGGGYAGAFLGGLFVGQRQVDQPARTPPTPPSGTPPREAEQNSDKRGAGDEKKASDEKKAEHRKIMEARRDEVEACLKDSSSWPMHWLRESGRYMSPNGAGDTLIAVAALLRNWFAIHVVLATAAVTVFAWMALANVGLLRLLAVLKGYGVMLANPSWSALALLPMAVLLVWAVPAAVAYWQNGLLSILLVILAAAAVAVASRDPSLWLSMALVATIAVISLVVGIYYSRKYPDDSRRRNLTAGLKVALVVVALLSAIALFDGLGRRLVLAVRQYGLGWPFVVASMVVGAPLGLVQRLAGRLATKTSIRPPVGVGVVAGLAAALVVFVGLATFSALVYAVALDYHPQPVSQTANCAVSLDAESRVRVGKSSGAANWPPLASQEVSLLALLALAIGGLVACKLLGMARAFANDSSHLQLYRARLTRAYLGASNPLRRSFSKAVTDPIPEDDVPWAQYKPHEWGGPIHLINVTVNETLSGETQLDQRDRKGLCLAVGPAGLSVGARHHGVWATPSDAPAARNPETGNPGTGLRTVTLQRVAPVSEAKEGGDARQPASGALPQPYQVWATESCETEEITLGHWVGISGAAFTPGLGSRTSLALSTLLGLANIRLGYWWDSGSDPTKRATSTPMSDLDWFWRRFARSFPVQAKLLEEILARFYGPAQQEWYLSDGGHFDNTGLYELVRRRVPFIVACDNGCDPTYLWDDLGNLVRKVRTDFGAEITMLDETCINTEVVKDLHAYVGPWTSFRPLAPRGEVARLADAASKPSPYATLARVTYPDTEETSTILIIKPAIRGDEPADILAYKAGHESFPQETTLDQYFDEAQWESYRKLGDYIGDLLFRRFKADGHWLPRLLRRIPEKARVEPAHEDARRSG